MTNQGSARAAAALLAALLSCLAPRAFGEAARPERPSLGHELALGITAVHDAGYDRGFHFALGYELQWSMLRASALLSLGDSDPRREQHWAIKVGLQPWSTFRLDLGFHHRTYTDVSFGENLFTLIGRLRWRGFEFAAGYVLRFPITDRDRIHSPFVFDVALFDHFLTLRIGYEYRFRNGVGLGLLATNHSRFELQNLDYPQFALVLSYDHRRAGLFRLEGGVGIAGFFNQGATIDRGFLRFEYVFRLGAARPAEPQVEAPPSAEGSDDDQTPPARR